MFNSSLKKSALAIHEQAVERYNSSYESMLNHCSELHSKRERAIVEIKTVQTVINTIAHTPKEFETQMGKVNQELLKFKNTQEYAAESMKAELKSGASIASGVAMGGAIASLGPTAAMSIATTFGTAATGTAIRTLYGAAAQKAAVAWIGRVTGGIATKGVITGAGMASGNAFLALAGPIGWGLSAGMTGVSLLSMSNKNKKISDEAVAEAKKIMVARNNLDETSEKIQTLTQKTQRLLLELTDQARRIERYKNADYRSLRHEEQQLLGTVVNNTLTLSCLVNQTVE
ncbi:MAG: hypothetical protein K2O18_15540 [Oscillospiraceae bacterium]|nr:hypothetical protein [Oscillospiraceae bacterium]